MRPGACCKYNSGDWSQQLRNGRPVELRNAKFSRDQLAMARPVSDGGLKQPINRE